MSTTTVADITTETKIVAISCGACGTVFGLGERFYNARREDHRTFYCPNGHPRAYNGPSEVEKERDRLERQLQWAREDRDFQREERIKAQRQRAAAKGQLTKTKNRIAAGVCPCCNRSFQNLAKHMAGQHPGYAGGGKQADD